MTGWIKVIGIGPGDEELLTLQAEAALAEATDAIGYIPYIERLASRENLTLHASDNRVEIERARLAFDLAIKGRKVAVVSSGDPGVFAMAAAVFEAMEFGEAAWKAIPVDVLPGITAMLAASARLGAPLGHDFCAINLSDNLKPFETIKKRVRAAVQGDFAMALYNPRSQSRPDGFGRVVDIIKEEATVDLLVIFARNVSRVDEEITITPLSEVRAEQADMRTLVIIGNQATHQIAGTDYVYAPRSER